MKIYNRQENSTDTGPSLPNRIEIPREIFLLVDYLYKNGLKTPNLFTVDRRYAKNPNINDIRDWLDIWETHNFGEKNKIFQIIVRFMLKCFS